MKRLSIFIAPMLALFAATCIFDSDDSKKKDDPPASFKMKTISLNFTELKLIEGQEVTFRVTSKPVPEPSELLVWHFIGPSSTDILQPASEENHFYDICFKEGDYILSLAIYDSTEFNENGLLAPVHGSLQFPFSVRRIAADIETSAGQSPQLITFTLNSPQNEWLHNPDYYWDFGDGETRTVANVNTVTHEYSIGGEYTVIADIKCHMYARSDQKFPVASDTLILAVEKNLSKELDIAISPQDTTWNTAWGLTLKVESNLTYSDYQKYVRWEVDWGDGGGENFEYYPIDRTVSHRYYVNGDYMLHVRMYDPATGDLLAQDSATIHISSLPFISQTNNLYFLVKGYNVRHSGILDAGGTFTELSTPWVNLWSIGGSTYTLSWDGRSFSSVNRTVAGDRTQVRTFNGMVSEDGETVVRLEYVYEFSEIKNPGAVETWVTYTRLVLENVPLTVAWIYSYGNHDKGVDIWKYVTGFEEWSRSFDPSNGRIDYTYYDDFDWQNTSMGTPEITLEFKKD